MDHHELVDFRFGKRLWFGISSRELYCNVQNLDNAVQSFDHNFSAAVLGEEVVAVEQEHCSLSFLI